MKDREPTVRSRELGEGLRQAMEQAGFHASEMARQLEWSPSRVSRLLAGKRGGSTDDVLAFVTVCGVRGAEKDRLLALAVDHTRSGWHVQHGPRPPKQLRILINHEDKAIAITEFEFNLIPGLLQTGEYARELISSAGTVPPEEIDERVSIRLGRKNLFSRRQPARFTFYIHEFALRLPVAEPAIMAQQLREIIRFSVRPNVTVRIVPASVGSHAAINGSFRLMEFRTIKPVVYLESETSSLFLDLPVEINAYRDIVAGLNRTALPEGNSREFISELGVKLYGEQSDDFLA